ncbi:hypothetical protein C0J52_25524 [Blattella germanica]|nr:hypothetical protein C0J52_25524 [Blattella germanica]
MATMRQWLLLLVCCVCCVNCQNQYNREYPPQYPYDSTYVYNNRRYGTDYDPGQGGGDPYNRGYGGGGGGYGGDPYNRGGYGNDGRYHFQEAPTGVPQPGVMARWRPDLQGKERPDSQEQFKKDGYVYVSTSYINKIQGFKVNLYDNPDPKSGYRPGMTPIERIMGTVSVFLGIPYAMPPVNEGRFRPPRRHVGAQLIQAVDFGPACPQPSRYFGATKGIRTLDEDCLYLNVYTPSTSSGLAQKYPVMFYIHGGEFIRGASNLFPGHVMAAFYEVVVVTINYRLGALGDADSPGNYGILDQAMALQWVYDNINSFNGDREKITLFGPGAGAASAGLLMVAPRTSKFVNKVIAQSGSAVSDWALIVDKYRAQNTSQVFAMQLGCSYDSSWKLVNCLKGRSFGEIGNAEFQPQVGLFPWGPVLDGNFTVPGDDWYEGWQEKDWHFMWKTPEEIIRRGEFNRGISYMSGVTTQEASFFIYDNDTLAPDYIVDNKFLLSDFLYKAPSDKMAKLLVDQHIPVYLYVTNTTIESFRLPLWRKAPHDVEHYLLTGAPFMDVEFFPIRPRLDRNMWTDNDRNMSHFFMKAYTDFAQYGNPTHTQILGLHFELARPGHLKYLNINTTFNSSILLNYRQTECAFWSSYLPTVIGHLVPTYPPVTETKNYYISNDDNSYEKQSDRYYNGDIIVLRDDMGEPAEGIDNHSATYEYRDTPPPSTKSPLPTSKTPPPSSKMTHNKAKGPQNTLDTRKTASTPSLRITGSAASLKDSSANFTTSSPTGEPRKQLTPVPAARKPRTRIDSGGVPQTEV